MTETADPLPPPKPLPRVSVVVPVFNGGPDLDHCLAAIAASNYPNFECIVVDDASTDGMAGLAAARHGARLIRLEKQKGPAGARNCGAKAASGEILFFTDADVLVHPDAVAIAVDTLCNDRRLGAVFGSYDDLPGHDSFLSQYRNLYHHWVHQRGNPEASTFWAGCGAVWRAAFLDLGGFAETYDRPSIEDIEFGYRLRRSGHRIRLERTMLGKHMKHWTFRNLLRTDLFQRGAPWVRLLLLTGQLHRDLNLDLNSRAATALACLFVTTLLVLPITGHPAATIPALAALLAGVLSAQSASVRGPNRNRAGILPTLLLVAVPSIAWVLVPDPWAFFPLGLLAWLVAAEWGFYRRVYAQRGLDFAIAVIPMRLLYFLVCAAAVPLGFIAYLRSERDLRTRGA